MNFVAILMGSESDRDVMKKAEEALSDFGVTSETNVISAHRKNAGLLAVQIMSTADAKLASKFEEFKRKQAES